MWRAVITIVLALPILSAQSTTDNPCVSTIPSPAYPRLARIAAVSGIVHVDFAIDAKGKASRILLHGHPLLTKGVENALIKADFGPTCSSANVEVTFRFELAGEPSDEAHTSVAFKQPDQFVVTSNPTGIICVLRSEVVTPNAKTTSK